VIPMDPAHATEAIWIDPLSYQHLKDGPPYLPGQNGGKVAGGRKVVGALEVDVFEHCMSDYGGAPMSELAVLLAAIRAEAMIHQAHHWQTRGSTYYGDHLLFERVYGEVNGLIDSLAERAVGAGQTVLVQPLVQLSHTVIFTKFYYSGAQVLPGVEELPSLSLTALTGSAHVLQLAYESLEARGLLTNGIDNLLQGIADKQEELTYLLGQRTKTASTKDLSMTTPKTALFAFQRELMTRRVASRFLAAADIMDKKEYEARFPDGDYQAYVEKKRGEGGGGGEKKEKQKGGGGYAAEVASKHKDKLDVQLGKAKRESSAEVDRLCDEYEPLSSTGKNVGHVYSMSKTIGDPEDYTEEAEKIMGMKDSDAKLKAYGELLDKMDASAEEKTKGPSESGRKQGEELKKGLAEMREKYNQAKKKHDDANSTHERRTKMTGDVEKALASEKGDFIRGTIREVKREKGDQIKPDDVARALKEKKLNEHTLSFERIKPGDYFSFRQLVDTID
jgi:hypothetical protein